MKTELVKQTRSECLLNQSVSAAIKQERENKDQQFFESKVTFLPDSVSELQDLCASPVSIFQLLGQPLKIHLKQKDNSSSLLDLLSGSLSDTEAELKDGCWF